MRRQGVLLALALVAGTTGCSSFLETAARNLTELPIQSCDEVRLHLRNSHRADEAWDQVRQDFPGQCWSKDYARGFKDGYADYLDYGGNGEPTATPPFIYRLHPYQTPDGLRAIEDWYAGFRHGAALARPSGYREALVIPLSSPPINAVERYPSLDPPLPGPVEAPGTLPTVPAPELLGQPQKVTRAQ